VQHKGAETEIPADNPRTMNTDLKGPTMGIKSTFSTGKASPTCNEGKHTMNYERVLEVKKEQFP
jgi:hypothetical protein